MAKASELEIKDKAVRLRYLRHFVPRNLSLYVEPHLVRLAILEQLNELQQVRRGDSHSSAGGKNTVGLLEHGQAILIAQMLDNMFAENILE